ncbi:MFS general substrate transporter, partial [Microstroma glucosiphilum]
FWLAFTAVFLSTFLSAVNFMIIAPIISFIAADMPPSKISPVWLASTSLATSISFLPLFRGLADAIDRGKALVSALMVFLVGSFVACLAHSMLDLVIGRGMQGLGGGGMLLIGQLVMSDLTTPSECGYFLGHVWLAFGLAAIVAPIAGGWFATFDWRWAFYIDVPLGVIALLLLWPAQLAKPKLPLHEKIRRLDFVGSIVLFGSTIALLFGLIDGGVYGLWTSASVWGSIVIGGAGVILFCVLETVPSPLVRDPILPAWLFRHRSSVIAYLLTFFHGFLFFGALQGLVIYFQVRQATPLRAAIDTLPLSVPLVPAAFITSMLTALTGRYKGSITACQALMTLSFLSFICMDPETLTRDWALYQVIGGIGLGGLHSLTFPVTCAAMPAEELAQAIGASVFVHSLGALWGVSSVLIAFQSQAGQRLVQIAGAANVGIDRGNVISFVNRLYGLPDSLREPLSDSYQKAIRVGFIVLAPFAFAGFVASLFIKQVPLFGYNQAE